MNFGALRVLNDDIVQAGQGFGKHPHDNMEIITIPLFGKLSHQDSMGHTQEIGVNEVQVMSAGSGIFHSEFNSSTEEEAGLLQIWIYPEKSNIEPSYDQKYFEPLGAEGKWQVLVSGNDLDPDVLHINQDAVISRVFLKNGQTIDYKKQDKSYGTFVFVIEGNIETEHEILERRDSIGIVKSGNFRITALTDSYILNIEVPDK